MSELFDKHGGFRRLHSFTLATIVQIETLRFCRRFLTFDHRETGAKFYDPKGRQYDQMTQAARSGRQNIIEGSERSSTSKDTEMKLTDVARASLSELRGDYEIFILDRNQLKSQIEAQGKAFEETGGFSERLMTKRIEAREKNLPPSPDCPQCGKPMKKRKSAKGDFWGCSAFPDCKGTRPV